MTKPAATRYLLMAAAVVFSLGAWFGYSLAPEESEERLGPVPAVPVVERLWEVEQIEPERVDK